MRAAMRRWLVPLAMLLAPAIASADPSPESPIPAELERVVEARPDDIDARMRLVRHLRAIGQIDRAIAHLQLAAHSAATPRDRAAEAEALRSELAQGELRLRAAIDDATSFVER